MEFGAFREDHSRRSRETYSSFYVNTYNLKALRPLIKRGDVVTYEPHQGETTRCKDLKLPQGVLVRYMHEFNLSPGDQSYWWGRIPSPMYKEAFVRFFSGSDNAIQVWSPNITYPGSLPIHRYYPGTKHVDLIAVDGYDWDGNTDPGDLFLPTIDRLHEYRKPMLIGETATSRDDKDDWLDLLTMLPVNRVTYFDADKERPWGLDAHANWPPT